MSKLFLPIAGKRITPYIHGQFTLPSQRPGRILLNPVDQSEITTVEDSTLEQVEEAVVSAKNIPHEWRTDGRYRRDCLLRLATRLEQHEYDLAQLETLQTGKPLSDAIYEMRDVVDTVRHFAGFSDKPLGQSIELGQQHGYTTRTALGTVALITSFNYPLLLAGWKVGPALATGNATILKPAPQTPLTALALADLSTDLLPTGTLSVLTGGVETSQALIRFTDKTSFTGSTRVGQEIMRLGSDRLLPVTLECGGKNAAIVFEDADLERAIEDVATGAFSNAGQNCCGLSRLFLHRSIHDRFLEGLVRHLEGWKAGREYGPLIDRNQMERVLGWVEGRDVFYRGQERSGGFFVPPTVLTEVSDLDPLAQEEIFGPVLSVLAPFEDTHDVIERANASHYGLAAGVFSQDLKKAHQTAQALKVGYVWVNTYNVMPPSLPFGGTKLSGIGKDLGRTALDEFTFEKSIMMDYS